MDSIVDEREELFNASRENGDGWDNEDEEGEGDGDRSTCEDEGVEKALRGGNGGKLRSLVTAQDHE